jgi:co-chaperonin GroES (HSP10)
MTNASGIQPTGFYVLVQPVEVEVKTKGGLYIPDDTAEKEGFKRTEGTIVAASPVAFDYANFPEGQKPGIGDHVIFAKYNATSVKGRDGGDYWLLKDEAIVAVMRD